MTSASPNALRTMPVRARPAVMSGGVAPAPTMATAIEPARIRIALSGALIAVDANEPKVLTIAGGEDNCTMLLPGGLLAQWEHLSLDDSLRACVAAQTGIDIGYTEQLYTFGETQARAAARDTELGGTAHDAVYDVSIGYLALLAPGYAGAQPGAHGRGSDGASTWVSCYRILPWEDFRQGRPPVISEIEHELAGWLQRVALDEPALQTPYEERVNVAFGLHGAAWDEERALERYELLVEAGLLDDDAPAPSARAPAWGLPLAYGHRRMLALAVGRLRGKIKYRPIVFELMEPQFTLFELQRTVEAILGTALHKQNFRRLIETTGLVEEVGDIRAKTGGRPAKLFKFRPNVVLERSAPGVRIKTPRA
jgi:hypothetical protein